MRAMGPYRLLTATNACAESPDAIMLQSQNHVRCQTRPWIFSEMSQTIYEDSDNMKKAPDIMKIGME